MNLKILYTVPPDYPERWKRWLEKTGLRGRDSTKRKKALRVADKAIVAAFVVMYVLLGLGCLAAWPGAIFGYVVSTAACFAVLSFLRARWNAPRPYEVFALQPLVPKEKRTAGRSFPSRHVFCAFLIATMAAIILRSPLGALYVLLACTLGVLRVLEGVHFPRDVAAGAALGVLAGLLCIAAVVG